VKAPNRRASFPSSSVETDALGMRAAERRRSVRVHSVLTPGGREKST
jgi:hypothetical protein